MLVLAVALATSMLVASLASAGNEPSTVRLPMGPASSETEPEQIVIVETGDHLWKISARRLHAHLGRSATNGEISPYWREVVDENRDRLRSGDPDLIYPGETVVLGDPAVSEQP